MQSRVLFAGCWLQGFVCRVLLKGVVCRLLFEGCCLQGAI